MAVTQVEDGRMTLVEHLVELRNRLIKSVLAVVVGALVCFIFYPPIFSALVRPYCESLSEAAKQRSALLTGDASTSCKLIARDPLEGFGRAHERRDLRRHRARHAGHPVAAVAVHRPRALQARARYARAVRRVGRVALHPRRRLAYWSIPQALEFLNTIGGPDLIPVPTARGRTSASSPR